MTVPSSALQLTTSVPRARPSTDDDARGSKYQQAEYMPLVLAARGHGEAADAALEDLLTLLYEPVRRYVLARVRTSVDAGDLAADAAQDALIRIAKGIRSCRARTDSEFIKWSLAVAHRVLLDLYRSRHTGVAAQQFAEEASRGIFGISMDESDGRRPEMSPPMERLLAILAEAYNGAVEATGELIWWRLIIGLEWSELGGKFGTTAAAAKRRFQRAQEVLRLEVIVRVDALPVAERADVLAVLTRFGYADALLPDQPVSLPAPASADPPAARGAETTASLPFTDVSSQLEGAAA